MKTGEALCALSVGWLRGAVFLKKEIRYFLNDDNPNILVRYTEPAMIHVLRKNEADWVLLPQDNSYLRELIGGQGNNCLSEITPEEAKRRAEGML